MLNPGHIAHDDPASPFFFEKPDDGGNGQGTGCGWVGLTRIQGRFDENGIAPG